MRSMITGCLLALLAAAGGGACSSHTAAGPVSAAPEGQARARIENRSSLDMDVYVRRIDGQTIRIGFVPGAGTAAFALNPAVLSGSPSVRFEARPVRGAGEAVLSEPFAIRPGDEVTWSVPPQ